MFSFQKTKYFLFSSLMLEAFKIIICHSTFPFYKKSLIIHINNSLDFRPFHPKKKLVIDSIQPKDSLNLDSIQK
jgi:hypothetical protein